MEAMAMRSPIRLDVFGKHYGGTVVHESIFYGVVVPEVGFSIRLSRIGYSEQDIPPFVDTPWWFGNPVGYYLSKHSQAKIRTAQVCLSDTAVPTPWHLMIFKHNTI